MADDSKRPKRVFLGIRAHDSANGLWIGLIIVALGVIFLLDQQGIVSASYIFRFFWPAIFIFLGIQIFLTGGQGRLWGAFLMISGVLLILGKFGYVHVGFYTLWPAAIILLGIALVVEALRPRPSADTEQPKPAAERDGFWARLNRHDSDSDWHYLCALSGVKKFITSKNFKKGSVFALFGGFEFDFTKADIEGAEATVDVRAIFGGGEIRVPESWDVSVRGHAFAGAFVDERHFHPDPASAKRLIIQGTAIFGGVAVKN